MHGRGHAWGVWQGACMTGGMCGRGHACPAMHARGYAWQGACVMGDIHGRGMHSRGSVVGGHVWWEGLHATHTLPADTMRYDQ